jgi:hypothetical protein
MSNPFKKNLQNESKISNNSTLKQELYVPDYPEYVWDKSNLGELERLI